MNSPNSAGTGIGRPSRLMQTNTNSAVAMRASSFTRRAVCRMVKLVRPVVGQRLVEPQHVAGKAAAW